MPSLRARAARMVMFHYPFPRGQGRIVDRTRLGRLQFSEDRLFVRTLDGFSMDVAPNDHIGRHLYLTGQFDRTIVEVLLRFARPDDRILDIGGNVGYYACALLHALPQCCVVSVEPQESVHAILAANVQRVGFGRGSTIRAAVSGTAGTGSMLHREGNTGASRLSSATTGAERVEVITGEMLMQRSGLDRLDLVKIDVEGHEEAVLMSIRPVLEQWRPRAIVFEHPDDLARCNPGVVGLFDELGYSLLGIHKRLLHLDFIPMAFLCDGKLRIHDYVAVPDERVGCT